MAFTKHLISLSDSRNLACYEYGNPSGRPVFYFHGGGIGSGMYAMTLNDAAIKSGIRLLAPDRPGIGSSDFKSDRTLNDWAKDVEEAADFLKLDHFSIVSESAGSAYAYLCAYKLRGRLNKVAVVSGLCPMDIKSLKQTLTFKNRITLGVLKHSPEWLLKKMFGSMKVNIEKNPDAFFKKAASRSHNTDREILAGIEFRSVYNNSIKNAFQQGAKGIIQDIRICSGPWGIDFGNILPEIHIWHGEDDESAPIVMTKSMTAFLKNCRASYLPDETHMSVLQNHAEEIFAEL